MTELSSNIEMKFDEFRSYCEEHIVTIDILTRYKHKYNYIESKILLRLCENPYITLEILQWIISNYSLDFLDLFAGWSLSQCPLIALLLNPTLTYELFTTGIDHVVAVYADVKILSQLIGTHPDYIYGGTILHSVFANPSFTPKMLEYLYRIDPQLDVTIEDPEGRSILFYTIVYSYYLIPIIEIIKSHELKDSRTIIQTERPLGYYSIRRVINDIAWVSDPSPVGCLVGLCGEVFHAIKEENLTQVICDQFYSSKYFQTNPNSLLKLIPKEFRLNLTLTRPTGSKTKPAHHSNISGQDYEKCEL
jgi:hypothetical protein